MISQDKINKTVVKFFKPIFYGKEFVNELARLLYMYQNVFYINNDKRLALFLANVKAEVATKRGKAVMRERMCYTTERLKAVFKFFRHNEILAEKYGKNLLHRCDERKIANIVYGKRLGNRGIYTNDGYKYRGAGILQTTGRENILKGVKVIEDKIGIKLTDDTGDVFDGILDNYTIGVLLGMAYWYDNKMYECKTFDCSVDIINKHTDSRKKRHTYYTKLSRYIHTLA